jgi:hypothetical protein
VRLEALSMKNSDTFGNRSRDLPVCSAVPQPLYHRVPAVLNEVLDRNERYTGPYEGVWGLGLVAIYHPKPQFDYAFVILSILSVLCVVYFIVLFCVLFVCILSVSLCCSVYCLCVLLSPGYRRTFRLH